MPPASGLKRHQRSADAAIATSGVRGCCWRFPAHVALVLLQYLRGDVRGGRGGGQQLSGVFVRPRQVEQPTVDLDWRPGGEREVDRVTWPGVDLIDPGP